MAAKPAQSPVNVPSSPPSDSPSPDRVDSTREARDSLTPEVVIALCGPIGSPLHHASDQIGNALSEFGYTTEKLRLSDLIRLNAPKVGKLIDQSSAFKETQSLIDAGDELRREFGNDVLAKLAIAKIGGDREEVWSVQRSSCGGRS